MADEQRQDRTTQRRRFLRQVSATAAVAGLAMGQTSKAQEKPVAASLPSIQLGPHRISRLIAGWNPVGGHSHATLDLSRSMREFFTLDRTVEFLQQCEREGITAWQFDHTDHGVAVIRKLREKGTQMNFICLHAERPIDAPIETVIKNTGAVAIVHQGSATDALFRARKSQKVHDFVKKVHDRGLLAGVSSHSPDHVKQVADEGWENDLFMTSFYNVARPREEQEELLNKVTVGEPFLESDPIEMASIIKQVKQPCLAFKILAAGRSCWSPHATEKAFRFAFANIKPIDGVIVGLFPRYSDQVHEDAEYTRKHGVV
jgi:hypothetical protein